MSNKKNIKIFQFFQPYKVSDLIRLGSSNDGGYLVSEMDVKLTDNLASLGTSFDWQFEKDFKRFNKKVKIHSFDGSVGIKYFTKNLKLRLKNLILKPSRKNLIRFINRLKLFFNFLIFYKFNLFKNTIYHHESFVGLSLNEDFNNIFFENYGYYPNSISFESFSKHIYNNTFLSIDIEGGEYDILNNIIDIQDKLIAIIIEFHDSNKNIEKIKEFISKLDLKIIHFHINNFGEIVENIPSVFELTFSRNSNIMDSKVDFLPDILDEKNNILADDFTIVFEPKN